MSEQDVETETDETKIRRESRQDSDSVEPPKELVEAIEKETGVNIETGEQKFAEETKQESAKPDVVPLPYSSLDATQVSMVATESEKVKALLVLKGREFQDHSGQRFKEPLMCFSQKGLQRVGIPFDYLCDAVALIKKAKPEDKTIFLHVSQGRPLIITFKSEDNNGENKETRIYIAPKLIDE